MGRVHGLAVAVSHLLHSTGVTSTPVYVHPGHGCCPSNKGCVPTQQCDQPPGRFSTQWDFNGHCVCARSTELPHLGAALGGWPPIPHAICGCLRGHVIPVAGDCIGRQHPETGLVDMDQRPCVRQQSHAAGTTRHSH